MSHSFELIIQKNLKSGMSLKDAICAAATDYPHNHREFLLSGKNAITLHPKGNYPDFRTAIKSIAEHENLSYSAALLEAGRRHQKLYEQYITELWKEKADERNK